MSSETEETPVIGDAVDLESPIDLVRRAIHAGATKFVIVYENGEGAVYVTPFGDPTRCDLAFYALILQQEAVKDF